MSVLYIALWMNHTNYCIALRYNKKLSYSDYTKGNFKDTKDKVIASTLYKVMQIDEFEIRLGHGFSTVKT